MLRLRNGRYLKIKNTEYSHVCSFKLYLKHFFIILFLHARISLYSGFHPKAIAPMSRWRHRPHFLVPLKALFFLFSYFGIGGFFCCPGVNKNFFCIIHKAKAHRCSCSDTCWNMTCITENWLNTAFIYKS